MASTYHTRIQDEFTRLRGTPFLLAATDFEIAERWRQAGIPLAVVLEAMRGVLEEGSPTGRIHGLKIVDRAVWRTWSDLGGSPAGPATEPGRRAEDLVAAVSRARLAGGEEIASAIRRLRGSVDERERRLADLDRRLLEAARSELGAGWVANRRRRAERALAGLKSRLDADQWELVCEQWVDESAREVLRLPRLTLFV